MADLTKKKVEKLADELCVSGYDAALLLLTKMYLKEHSGGGYMDGCTCLYSHCPIHYPLSAENYIHRHTGFEKKEGRNL